MRTILSIVAAALVTISVTVQAQKPVNVGDAVSATFTIVAIDHSARIVTLEDKDKATQDVYCGPDVKRFDALKVGDKVTFRYYESMVTAISRPGAAKAPVSESVTRSAGTKPGGTVSQQMTASVTIDSIDTKVGAVTIRNAAGKKMSLKVDNKKNLEGYKAGDKVDITYTQALAISVDTPK